MCVQNRRNASPTKEIIGSEVWREMGNLTRSHRVSPVTPLSRKHSYSIFVAGLCVRRRCYLACCGYSGNNFVEITIPSAAITTVYFITTALLQTCTQLDPPNPSNFAMYSSERLARTLSPHTQHTYNQLHSQQQLIEKRSLQHIATVSVHT